MVIEIAARAAPRRYNHRAGELQTLLSHNHGSPGIPGPIASAVVVVPEVIRLLEESEIGIIRIDAVVVCQGIRQGNPGLGVGLGDCGLLVVAQY